MKQLAWRRALTFIALVSILVQSFSPLVALTPQKVFAQEITQETTVTPTETPTTTPTPAPDLTTTTPTPIVTPSETPTIIPSPTIEETVTPQATPTDSLSPPKDVTPSPTVSPVPSVSPTPAPAPTLKTFNRLVLSATLNIPTTTVYVNSLQPNWDNQVWAAYYAPDSIVSSGVSPGSTAIYDGREAAIIKAGITPENGHYLDEGLLAFKVNADLPTFASQALNFDVDKESGSNPVWVRIRLSDSNQTEYQFVPTSNPSGWHNVNAAAGSWQLMDDNGNATGSLMSLSQVAVANPGISVDRVYLTLGQGDSYNVSPGVGTVNWVDKVTIGNTVYDFVLNQHPVPSCNPNSSFDSFDLGSVNGQGGWTILGRYEQEVVNNTYNYSSFGCKSLRVSDSITSGSFGDQLFAPPVTNGAGESSATAGAFSIGTRQNHFEAQFDIASTMLNQQTGLHLSVSPDRGDGSRMSYLRFEDNADGIDVFFDDVEGTSNPANFVETKIDTLDRNVPHTVKFSMDFLDGPSNDIVKIYIDGNLVHTGTSWENYYRFDTEAAAEQSTRIVKTVLFRQAGPAVPADKGNGFLIDNFSSSSTTVSANPTTNPATNILSSDATLNGVNGGYDAIGHSFWVSQSPFSTSSPNIPSGVYSTPDMGNIASNASFTALLSSLTTNAIITGGVHSTMPAIKPNTTYYYVAWSRVGGTWYPGAIQSFTTHAIPVPTMIFTANSINVPTNGYTNSKTFTFNLSSSSDVTRYQLKYWNNIPSSIYKINTPWNPTNLSAYSSSLGVYNDNFSQGEGVHYFAFSACDAAGNCSAYSAPFVITYDKTAPIAQVTSPANGALLSYADNGTVDVRGTVTDTNPDHYYLIITGPNGYSVGPGTVYDTSSFTDKSLFNWNLHGLTSGSYTIDLEARDKANNKDAGSINVHTVTIDNTAPTAPTITSPTNGQYFKAIPITAHWSAVADASGIAKYQVGYVYDDHHTFSGSTCSDLPNGGCRDVAGNVTSRGHVPGLNEQGGVTIYIRAVDNAGNVGAWSTPVHYVFDATAPTLTANPLPGDQPNNPTDVTLTANDNLSGVENVYYTTDGTNPATSATRILYTAPIVVDQDLTINAIAYDNAGNSTTFTGDYNVPPVISNQSIVRTNDNSVLITWTTNFPATSRVVYDTVSHSTLGSAPNYGYAYSTTEDTNKVTSHSVTITGLTVNQDYYYRTISAGSPEAVGNETAFATYYVFGLAGDGKSDGKSDGLSSCPGCTQTPQLVLGASTSQQPSSEQLLASNDKGTQGDVLGASTESAKVQTEKTTTGKVASSSSNLLLWSILFLVALLILFFIYKKIIKKSASN